jgi:hypothetical protein
MATFLSCQEGTKLDNLKFLGRVEDQSMLLEEKLVVRRTESRRKASKERIIALDDLTHSLRENVIPNIIAPGLPLPKFSMPNAKGMIFKSNDLIAKGPLVVQFFRGHW